MCHLPLSYPTTFTENCSWWLRQLLFWEWGGRTVSPHPHAHSTPVDFTHVGNSTLTTIFVCFSPHAQALGGLVSRRHFLGSTSLMNTHAL